MGNRYYLTGSQLGMLMGDTDEGIRMKLLQKIMDDQQLGPRISLKLNSDIFDDEGRLR